MSTTSASPVMTTIEDDSAPLLPHELSALTAPPPLPTTPLPHRSKQLPQNITSTHGQTPLPQPIVSPAVPVVLHRHPPRQTSPLEPFPAFDPRVRPLDEPPYYYLGAAHRDNGNDAPPAGSEPQQQQCREHGGQENHYPSPNAANTPAPAPATSTSTSTTSPLLSSHGEKLMIRCHTLCALAERLFPSTSASTNRRALLYLHEAKRVLTALEKQSGRKLCDYNCTPQQQALIQFSAGNLREKLRVLEERSLAEKEGREADELNEKTGRVTAWLDEL
ncbi:uncharacterized protein BKCO1_5400058 [Diplodia corticola]|uniref:Uncharacterized protein n=1 Tax=Diplodia corticola TaxID=236234 RepID=A0A1J9RR81_9PEZI|nr:uncharacterized protein BKCO1_5400058 [Diplodia corticola]OJD30935.1 hypothetical protein BKCO1_5400058 [Diplodia corticola]